MAVNFLGTEGLKRMLAKIGAETPREAARALWQEAEEIKDKAFHLCPKDDGVLRGSLGVTVPRPTMGEIEVTIYAGGPAAPYAVVVHEHPSSYDPPSWRGKAIHWSLPGTGPKFLERPYHEFRSNAEERLAKRIDLNRVVR